jgi:hypothetical protein
MVQRIKSWRIVPAIGLILITVFLIGCALGSRPVDRSILADDPCAAPCWQGIVPGQTTMAEAMAIVETIGIYATRFGHEVQWHSEYYRGDGFNFAGNHLYASNAIDSSSLSERVDFSVGKIDDKPIPCLIRSSELIAGRVNNGSQVQND